MGRFKNKASFFGLREEILFEKSTHWRSRRWRIGKRLEDFSRGQSTYWISEERRKKEQAKEDSVELS